MKKILIIPFLICLTLAAVAQKKHLPIIDIHVHTMKVNPNWASPICPWFLSSMPGDDLNDKNPSFMKGTFYLIMQSGFFA